jgi:hypothetical protein
MKTNAIKLLFAIWKERLFIGLLANLTVLFYMADLVKHKDVEIDGGISASEMSDLLSKGIDVNISKIADEELTFDAVYPDNGYSLRVKSLPIPLQPGQIPLSQKPLPNLPISWGYIHPESQ